VRLKHEQHPCRHAIQQIKLALKDKELKVLYVDAERSFVMLHLGTCSEHVKSYDDWQLIPGDIHQHAVAVVDSGLRSTQPWMIICTLQLTKPFMVRDASMLCIWHMQSS